MYNDGHKNIIILDDGHKVEIGSKLITSPGTSVPNHMGLPIITDERMPTGMIVLMGPNGEMYVL